MSKISKQNGAKQEKSRLVENMKQEDQKRSVIFFHRCVFVCVCNTFINLHQIQQLKKFLKDVHGSSANHIMYAEIFGIELRARI